MFAEAVGTGFGREARESVNALVVVASEPMGGRMMKHKHVLREFIFESKDR